MNVVREIHNIIKLDFAIMHTKLQVLTKFTAI